VASTDADPAVSWESTAVLGPAGHVPVRVFRPAAPTAGWLVWAHGGSWHGGSVDAWHDACADLALRTGLTVASVEYRLAPRHRHPAAIQDVLTVMHWAQGCLGTGGQLVVGGDSAGGTIASCAALAWRDEHRRLAAQILAYPPLDPSCRADSYGVNGQRFPSRAGLMAAWQSYRGRDYERTAGSLYSTPLEATDLSGVAPTVLAVGNLDPVLGDVREHARRLGQAGVTVRLREFAGLGHGAFRYPAAGDPPDPAVESFRGWLATALREVLPVPSTGGTAVTHAEDGS
jgi:acetyl esterase